MTPVNYMEVCANLFATGGPLFSGETILGFELFCVIGWKLNHVAFRRREEEGDRGQ